MGIFYEADFEIAKSKKGKELEQFAKIVGVNSVNTISHSDFNNKVDEYFGGSFIDAISSISITFTLFEGCEDKFSFGELERLENIFKCGFKNLEKLEDNKNEVVKENFNDIKKFTSKNHENALKLIYQVLAEVRGEKVDFGTQPKKKKLELKKEFKDKKSFLFW
jgi:hypothetical protein